MSTDVRSPTRWFALAVLCGSVLVLGFDLTILNVALPALVRALGAGSNQLQWIVDAYSLVFAGLLLTTGSLGDRFGRRRVLIAGLLLFGLGSACAAASGSPGELIAVRAVMGLGGALIMPSTLATMIAIFPRSERPRAIAVLTASTALGIPIGPIVGGWLLDRFSWHAVFLVNVPLVAATLIGVALLVPESRSPIARPLDPIGAVLSVAGLTALLYAIIEAPVSGWTAAGTLLAGALGLTILAIFLLWEIRNTSPMLPLELFADPRFSVACISITLVYFAMTGSLFFLTQYLQFILGFDPLSAGVRIVPLTLGLAIGAPIGSVLVRTVVPRIVVALGLAGCAGGLCILLTCTGANGYVPVALSLAVFGAGIGLAATPASDALLGAVPEDRFGVGSAVNDTTQEVGGALGVAILGSVLAGMYSSSLAGALHGLPAPVATAARSSLGGALALAAHLGSVPGAVLRHAAIDAFVSAMHSAALAGAGMSLLGALVALLWLPGRPIAETLPVSEVEREGVPA